MKRAADLEPSTAVATVWASAGEAAAVPRAAPVVARKVRRSSVIFPSEKLARSYRGGATWGPPLPRPLPHSGGRGEIAVESQISWETWQSPTFPLPFVGREAIARIPSRASRRGSERAARDQGDRGRIRPSRPPVPK